MPAAMSVKGSFYASREESKSGDEESKTGTTALMSGRQPVIQIHTTEWVTREQTEAKQNMIHLNPEEQVRIATEGVA